MSKKLVSLKQFSSLVVDPDRLRSIVGGYDGDPTAVCTNRTGDDNSRPDPT